MTEVPMFRFPRNGEMLGYVTQMLGFGRMYVKCTDDKIRLCQVKGSFSRYLWINEGDIVLVKPWEIEHDKKADVLYKYRKNEWDSLRAKGYLKDNLLNGN
ncbi:MAG: S1 IF1 family protein [Candidatus Parvarchaeum acidophilus ARMAN-5]|jgi:translation initiation factor 1A|uniref:Translation initiation factor 1A n=1 Tax=Candidatus Parvarchaeum acidophilus ARMAN-5 TaxID=662762 RepID=D6GVN9_PARA5|nr:MAG: S1 IF1 family protein [Candidatus Parvarchaeum acidophilus ARMAN-5]